MAYDMMMMMVMMLVNVMLESWRRTNLIHLMALKERMIG
jgi:hypothetical protein